MPTAVIRSTFNGGEVDPALRYRSDLVRYQNSCLKMRNALVSPFGAAVKRPGTRHRGYYFDRTKVWMVPFQPDDADGLVVVFDAREGDLVHLVVWDGERALVDFETDYPAESIHLLQTVQSYDVLLIAHPDVPLMRLERRPDGWVFRKHMFRGGPWQEYDPEREVPLSIHYDTWSPGAHAVGDCLVQGPLNNNVGFQGIYLKGADWAPTPIRYDESGIDLEPRVVQWRDGDVIRRRYYRLIEFRFNLPGDDDNQIAWTSRSGPGVGQLLRIRGSNFAGAWKVRRVSPSVQFTEGYVAYDAEAHFISAWCDSPYYWKEEEIDPGTLEVLSVTEVGAGMHSDVLNDVPAGTLDGATGTRLWHEFVGPDSPDPTMRTLWRCTTARTASNTAMPSNDTGAWKRVDIYEQTPVFALSDDKGIVSGDDSLLSAGPFRGRDGNSMRFRTEGARSRSAIFGLAGTPQSIWLKDEAGDVTPTDGGVYTNTDVTRTFRAFGAVVLRTEGGTWRGEIVLEASTDEGETWEAVRTIVSNGDRNTEVEFVTDQSDTLVRARMRSMEGVGDGSFEAKNQCRFTIEFQGQDSVYDVADVQGSGHLAQLNPGQFLQGPFPANVRNYSFGAFSDLDGYPAAVAIHEERLIVAGTRARPGTIYGSAVNDWEEFAPATLETSPITLTLATTSLSQVRWLMSRQELVVGLASGEWTIGSRSMDRILSGETLRARNQTNYGSDPVPPLNGEGVTLFVTRGGQRVRAMQYAFQSDGYESIDLSVFASHLTEVGVRSMAMTKVPWLMFWIATRDGRLLSLTWIPEQEVLGWAQHDVGGKVLALTANSQQSGASSVWMLVNRGTDESPRTYLEELRIPIGWSDPAVYLDGHVVGAGDPLEATLPPDASGDLVFAAGGRVLSEADVDVDVGAGPDGRDVASLTGDAAEQETELLAGYPYEMTLTPMPLSAHGSLSSITKVSMWLLGSAPVEAEINGGGFEPALLPGAGVPVDGGFDMDPLIDGEAEIPIKSGTQRELVLTIRSRGVLPSTVAALGIRGERSR